MITENQMAIIRHDLDASGVTLEELKDDLYDHFCCYVEEAIRRGESFETAYANAREEICPGGFEEIQHETLFLLNSHKLKTMKMLTYTLGLASAMATVSGLLFKILHWPGGDQLFIGGILALSFVFFPILFFIRYKTHVARLLSEKMMLALVIAGYASLLLVSIGLVLKITHTPFADLSLLIGFVLFILGFLPSWFFRMYKKSVE